MLATWFRDAPMTKLHWFPGNASLIPHLLLEEIGCRFELAYVDRAQAAHKSAPYLALNPNGLIPVLEDDGEVLYETAAICQHLCERHPDARLLPAVGAPGRAHALQWLAWLGNTLQPALIVYFYPERWAEDAAAIASVRAHAEARVGTLLDLLDAELAARATPWLAGDRYGALDAYAFVLCRWTRGFAQPARTLPHLAPWLERVLARPATQRTLATEGLQPPFV